MCVCKYIYGYIRLSIVLEVLASSAEARERATGANTTAERQVRVRVHLELTR